MAKLVTLEIGKGTFEQGFPVTLRIKEEDTATDLIQKHGELPHKPNLLNTCQQWQTDFRHLVVPSPPGFSTLGRGIKGATTRTKPLEEYLKNCTTSFKQAEAQLNSWLNAVEHSQWRKIRDTLQRSLGQDEEIRVVLQTDVEQLRRLPWSAWSLFSQDYPKAEIALGTPEYSRPQAFPPSGKTRILLILGYCGGLNLTLDRQVIAQLANYAGKEPFILQEPSPDQLRTVLTDPQGWHLLCYAGHSYSQEDGTIGWLQLQQNGQIGIADLNHSLATAIANGLQLAIFNSCDGLGLAYQLAHLNLPQSIVMREPVPDEVAPKFLEKLLLTFASGCSLYTAVRNARRYLEEAWNRKYPGISWLPVICQNPSVAPLSWKTLGGKTVIPPCPYRGLSAFTENDANFFFGREAFISQLLQALDQKHLITVLGPSGSGKSSVVFAGLLPRYRTYLKQRELNLTVVSFRPGIQPCNALAKALASSLTEQDAELVETKLLLDLEKSDRALQTWIEQITHQPRTRLLLIIDQFEEVFTLCSDCQQRQAFLDNLLQAIYEATGLRIILTVRSDFLNQLQTYEFNRALQIFPPELLGPMNSEELKAAIIQPALLEDVRFETWVVERLLAEMKQPERLPLLEFALTELWAKQSDRLIRHQDYQAIGGVEEALVNYAEEVYKQLHESDRQQTQRVFTQLVHPGNGAEDTRRLATRTEVGEENWTLVSRLADTRLIITQYNSLIGEETVEVVHEALIRHWPRLSMWVNRNREFRSWQEQLRTALSQWIKSGTDKEALLGGRFLSVAEGWLNERSTELTESEQSFIQKSLEQRTQQQNRELEQERKARKAAQRIARLAVAVALSLVTTGGIGGLAWQQWQQRQEQELVSYALNGELTPEIIQRILPLLPTSLRQAEQYQRSEKIEQSLEEYRRIHLLTRRIEQQMNNTPQNFTQAEELRQTNQAIAQQSQAALWQIIRQDRLPALQAQLQKKQFGQMLNAIAGEKEQQYTSGAIQTTYKILFSDYGLQADLNQDGFIDLTTEADLIPCELIATLEKLWREASNNRCGWYGLDSYYENEACSELSVIGKDKIFDPVTRQVTTHDVKVGGTLLYAMFHTPADAAIARIDRCQVIPKPVN